MLVVHRCKLLTGYEPGVGNHEPNSSGKGHFLFG